MYQKTIYYHRVPHYILLTGVVNALNGMWAGIFPFVSLVGILKTITRDSSPHRSVRVVSPSLYSRSHTITKAPRGHFHSSLFASPTHASGTDQLLWRSELQHNAERLVCVCGVQVASKHRLAKIVGSPSSGKFKLKCSHLEKVHVHFRLAAD